MIRLVLKLWLVAAALLFSATTSIALPDCPSDQTKWYHDCFGTYIYLRDEKYVGEFKDNKRNGKGTYTFADGEKYVGEWKDDMRNGQGTNTFANGEQYVGEFKDNKRNGKGTYSFADGQKYVGEWKDDIRNGQGTNTFASGEKYVGEWRDGKRNGQGTNTYRNGEKYVGGFEDDKKTEKGFYVWPNGKADLCSYAYDKHSNCSGSDVYDVAPILTDKFRQLTEFQRRQIQSSLKSMDLYSSTIDGKWGISTFSGIASYAALNLKTININNNSTAKALLQKIMGSNGPDTSICPADDSVVWDNCYGTLTFGPNSQFAGDKYVGMFKGNKFHGQGAYTFGPNSKHAGDKYVGEYKNGNKYEGTYTFGPNSQFAGEKYIGEWKDNKNHGQGT
ncbi:MAG: hypothetical protein P8L40_00475, partial [Planktomarina sp.]|nr:hypothetical protein [Planktomarina sp.]